MKILLVCNYKPGVGGISGQVEALQRHLHEEGHVADLFSTKGTVWQRLAMSRQLHRKAMPYDIMHIHCCSGWGFLPAVLGVSVGRRLGKRVVLTYHGGGAECFFARHHHLVHRYLTRSDTNIVLSGFLGKVFDGHRIPYTIIPNIIELDSAHYRSRDTLQPHYICTRAHEPLYNIPCILRAFAKVKQQLPTATLTLVGDGSQHQELVAQAPEGVVFAGRVDNSEIYRYLDKADIFLSAPTVDNMPVSVLEAMNAGLLVISSSVGGVPYMIEDRRTGLLFDSDDSDALADRMMWAVRHTDEVHAITASAHHEVANYQWENVRDKLYGAYYQ